MALLHHRLQYGKDLGIVYALVVALASRCNVAVLEGGQNQTHGGDRALLLRLHGFLQGLVELGTKHGCLTADFERSDNVTEKQSGKQPIVTTQPIEINEIFLKTKS